MKIFFWIPFIFVITTVNAGLNNFTNLVFVEDWLIERKVDLNGNEIKCRASIPSYANWFGDRVRLGTNDELIIPLWISFNADKLNSTKLTKIKEILDDCRSQLLFFPNNI